ncbi:hypothetical protein TNCV_4474241 [Trichonephila clavipes]|nr:hypothetical protein TNCV_4474241 [Trichonephila clavipes]
MLSEPRVPRRTTHGLPGSHPNRSNTPTFMWCSRPMFLAPQYPDFSFGCSQRDTQDWTPGVKDSLCKTVVECFPGNSALRNSSKDTRKLRIRCPPVSSCA